MKIYSAQHRAIVEAPIMEKPNIESTKYSYRTYSWECDAFDAPKFEADTKAYQEWLKTHIPVLPEHQHLFKDGQEVKEGIDYDRVWYNYGGFDKPDNYNWVAIPIKQQVKESPDNWVSVKENGYPEHNIGVLVFIPEEDFHITSGMWDISNKWVLLDEYRVPDCEVTHWRRLPDIPKEHKKEQEENNSIMNFLSDNKDFIQQTQTT